MAFPGPGIQDVHLRFGPLRRECADRGEHDVRGRALQVRKPASLRSLGDCHVLFISSSERRRIHTILNAVRGMDLLTVGDTEGYAQEGVMVNFYIEASKVKFEINLKSIRSSRITVSSQLLKLGRVVDGE